MASRNVCSLNQLKKSAPLLSRISLQQQGTPKAMTFEAANTLTQCFSTSARLRPGKFCFYKTRARFPTYLLVTTLPIFLSSYIKLT